MDNDSVSTTDADVSAAWPGEELMDDPRDESKNLLTGGRPAWLTRLTAEQWLRVSWQSLLEAERADLDRNERQALAAARRAAGMALNAVLCVHFDPAWGRDYVAHLRAVADPGMSAPGALEIPPLVRAAAACLVEAAPSTSAGMLIQLSFASKSATPVHPERLAAVAELLTFAGEVVQGAADGSYTSMSARAAP
jgi:HEPN domain-containing protein